MSNYLAKKQEALIQKKVRDLLLLEDNKKCFDCPTRSPFFVNITLQTVICSRCSGLVREVGHRVKSISASKFTGPELMALEQGGNASARRIWLSNFSTHNGPEPENDADVRSFMRQKYFEYKWLDREALYTHEKTVKEMIKSAFTDDGFPIGNTQKSIVKMAPTPTSPSFPVNTTMNEESMTMGGYRSSSESIRSDSRHSIGSFSDNVTRTSQESARYSVYSNNSNVSASSGHPNDSSNSHMTKPLPPVLSISVEKANQWNKRLSAPPSSMPVQQAHSPVTLSQPVTPNIAQNIQKQQPSANAFSDILSDLSGLKMEPTVKRATYTGGILAPLTPTKSVELKEKTNSLIDPSVFPQFQKAKETEKKADVVVKDKKQDEYDPYQALRGMVYENPVVPVQQVEQEESKELKPLEFPQDDDDDEDEWQEFCSSSSVDDNSLDENEISLDAVVESTLKMQDEQEEKPPVIDIFNDLNPFSSIKRF